MFIRIKKIKGKPYAYLVENKWKDGTTRQRVKQYLGRVYLIDKRPPVALPKDIKKKDILNHIIKHESNNELGVSVNYHKATVKRGKQHVVLQLNGGYLCKHTIKQLKQAFKKPDKNDTPGLALAEAFRDAGLRIPQKAFVTLYLEAQK